MSNVRIAVVHMCPKSSLDALNAMDPDVDIALLCMRKGI
jgi:hypothetical protein